MSKNEFYYKILNIGNKGRNIEIILDKIIKHEIVNLGKDNKNFEGLCKVMATNVSIELDKERVDYRVVNLVDYNLYDHTFIVARNMEKGNIQYYLIDPTFIQFRGYFPYINLEKKDVKILSNLLESGYSKIDNKDYNLYFSSFEYDNKLDLNDLFLEINKKSKLSR